MEKTISKPSHSSILALLQAYQPYVDYIETVNLLEHDLQTIMPSAGESRRSELIARYKERAHGVLISDVLENALQTAETAVEKNECTFTEKCIAEETRHMAHLAKLLPTEFVLRRAEAETKALVAWERFRGGKWPESDYLSALTQVFSLTQEYAQRKGYAKEPYDACLDDFERGTTAEFYAQIFAALTPAINRILDGGIMARQTETWKNTPKVPILASTNHAQITEALMCFVLGDDSSAFRLDLTEHPYCAPFHSNDIRIATRRDCFGTTDSALIALHESGHALFEKQISPHLYYSPLARLENLGLHESQSRLWENHIGRSHAFAEYFSTLLEKECQVSASPESLYAEANRVARGCIRVTSDELTYHLHIALRFELERSLINGQLATQDLPEAWNTRMQELIGITPQNADEGYVQDVHWAHGMVGYFPAYTLGNVYAAELYKAYTNTHPNLELAPDALRAWLEKNIHTFGSAHMPLEVVTHAIGYAPTADALLEYLENKFSK